MENENGNNQTKYVKPSLLHPEGNPFDTAPGFNFNRNDFEDLIDDFTPKDDVPILLGVTHSELNKFCSYVYNMNYNQTYEVLLKRSQLYYRKAMMTLSKSGNPSAIKIASEFYVGLGKTMDDDSRITIVNVMPNVDSDLDKKQNSYSGPSEHDQFEAFNKMKQEMNSK